VPAGRPCEDPHVTASHLFGVCILVSLGVALPRSAPRAGGSCVVIDDLSLAVRVLQKGESCSMPLSPASTFKIPHALVALETGVVTEESVRKWDGTRYDRQAEWNHDHTVISALRPSVLWFFQRIAPEIGAGRMAEWLEQFKYGNRDTSGPITQYWLNGHLRISPIDQVAFLSRFYQETLPVSIAHMRAVRGGLEQRPGTVQNALGVQRVDGDWRNSTLNAKTGATTTPEYSVSWLVGLVRAKGRDLVFAAAVWKKDGAVDSLEGTRLAVRAFIEAGLVPR